MFSDTQYSLLKLIMSKISKLLVFPLLFMISLTVIYFAIDYGGSDNMLSVYNAVKPKSSSGFNKSLQFMSSYMRATGDTTIAVNKGLTREDVEEIIADNGYGLTDSNVDYDVKVTASASVQEIISMDEKAVWNLISANRFDKYKYTGENDENKTRSANYNCKKSAKAFDEKRTSVDKEKEWWEDQMTTIKVEVWVWEDKDNKDNKNKIEVEKEIKVNKALEEYWESFFKDLHACSEKWVIEKLGSYNYRPKNNSSNSGNYSSHSFGVAIDINWDTPGMKQGIGGKNCLYQYNSEAYKALGRDKDMVCAVDSSWWKLAKAYGLTWGGNWGDDYYDGMHFSLAGDGSKRKGSAADEEDSTFTPKETPK